MKRILTALLTAAMLVGMLAGCARPGGTSSGTVSGGETGSSSAVVSSPAASSDTSTPADEPAVLGENMVMVGFGKADISPQESVPLTGYGDHMERWSTQVSHPLEILCVAFTDKDNNKMLFLVSDLLGAYETGKVNVRYYVSIKTGIPVDRIMYHATHNHSGPGYNLSGIESVDNYVKVLLAGAAKAAQDAIADQKPAHMSTTFTRPEGINWVRHYLLDDGKYQGEAVGLLPKSRLIGHTTVADNLLQMVKFTREGAKDIIMVNWQGHPRSPKPTYPYTTATGNYPAVMREKMNEELDCQTLFVLGGSGNLNNNSQIVAEKVGADYVELGEILADKAIEAAANFTPADAGEIQFVSSNFLLVNKTGTRKGVPLYAFSIGDFAMVTAPFEIFDTNAMAVRDASDFPMTFYASCANGSNGYLPTDHPFDFYAYEVRVTKYPMGTAALVQDELIRMLDVIFAASGNEVKEKAPGYETPEFVPSSNGKTYTNPNPGDLTACKAVENGFYSLVLREETALKNMLAISKEVAEKVLSRDTMKLIFDQSNVILDVVP